MKLTTNTEARVELSGGQVVLRLGVAVDTWPMSIAEAQRLHRKIGAVIRQAKTAQAPAPPAAPAASSTASPPPPAAAPPEVTPETTARPAAIHLTTRDGAPVPPCEVAKVFKEMERDSEQRPLLTLPYADHRARVQRRLRILGFIQIIFGVAFGILATLFWLFVTARAGPLLVTSIGAGCTIIGIGAAGFLRRRIQRAPT